MALLSLLTHQALSRVAARFRSALEARAVYPFGDIAQLYITSIVLSGEIVRSGGLTTQRLRRASQNNAFTNLTRDVPVPRRGDRVRVTGAFVTDLDHGWNEI